MNDECWIIKLKNQIKMQITPLSKKLVFRSSVTSCFIFFVFCSNLFAQSEKYLSLGEQAIFKVSKTTDPIVIDGKMNEKAWEKTEARKLNYYYRIDKPDDQQETVFRMLWDNENLYVFFDCNDQFITAREKNRDGEPFYDDCAEIFLIPVPDSLNMHLGFEINLYKASNDFIFFNNFYKGNNGLIKAFNPDFKVEVTVRGTVNDNSDIDQGWRMEMSIPLITFKGIDTFCPVKSGNKWAFLAVRQDRNDSAGNRRSTYTIFPIYDIGKGVHQPNRFGLLQFVE